ncbi:TPA: fimbrial protein [Kluyvera georgiana]
MGRSPGVPFYRRLMAALHAALIILLFSASAQAATQTFVLGGTAYASDGGPVGDGTNALSYPSGRTVYFSRSDTLAPANVTINWNGSHGSSSGKDRLYCTSTGAATSNRLSVESGLVPAGSYGGAALFKTNITGLYFSLTLRSFSAYALSVTASTLPVVDGIMHNVITVKDNGHICSDTSSGGMQYNSLGGLGFYAAITFYTDQTYTPVSSKISLLKNGDYHVRIWNENPGSGIKSYYQNVTIDVSAVSASEPTCTTQPAASGSSVNGTTVNLGSYSPNQIIRGAAAVPFAINLAGCRGLRNINVTLTTTTPASNRTMLGNILTMNQATGVGVEISGVANGYSPQMVLLPNDTTSVYSEQRDTSGDDNIYGTSENGKNQSLTLNFLATLKRDGNQKIGSGNFKANGIFTLDYP